MKIGGRGLGDHLRLLAPLFGLIAAVWALRLVLDLAGAPRGVVRIFSVTVAGPLSVLIAVLLIHLRRFGSYASVIASAFILVLWVQLLVVLAVGFATLTGTSNIYIAPEYSFGSTAVRHIAGHLTIGLAVGGIFGSGMGCALFWMLRRVAPAKASGL